MAAAPPSHSALRTAGSASLVSVISFAASDSGDSALSSLRTIGIVGTERLAHLVERERQRDLFEVRIQRRGREQARRDLWQIRIRVLTQALLVALAAFLRATHQRAGVSEQPAVEASTGFQIEITIVNLLKALLRGSCVIPRLADRAAELRIRGHFFSQLAFLRRLAREQRVIEQRRLEAAIHLERVLHALDGVAGDAGRLVAGLAPLNQPAAQLGVANQIRGDRHIALKAQLFDGEQAAGAAGMADDERRFARLRAFDSPGQMIRRAGRLALLVHAHQAEIQAPAREVEVVRIAAERGDRMLQARTPCARRRSGDTCRRNIGRPDTASPIRTPAVRCCDSFSSSRCRPLPVCSVPACAPGWPAHPSCRQSRG